MSQVSLLYVRLPGLLWRESLDYSKRRMDLRLVVEKITIIALASPSIYSVELKVNLLWNQAREKPLRHSVILLYLFLAFNFVLLSCGIEINIIRHYFQTISGISWNFFMIHLREACKLKAPWKRFFTFKETRVSFFVG